MWGNILAVYLWESKRTFEATLLLDFKKVNSQHSTVANTWPFSQTTWCSILSCRLLAGLPGRLLIISVFQCLQWKNEDDNNNIYLIGSWKEENDLIEAKCLGEYFINAKYDVKCKHFLLFLSTLKWRLKVKIKMKKKEIIWQQREIESDLNRIWERKTEKKKKKANKSLQEL